VKIQRLLQAAFLKAQHYINKLRNRKTAPSAIQAWHQNKDAGLLWKYTSLKHGISWLQRNVDMMLREEPRT
jgi:hypothetical protein